MSKAIFRPILLEFLKLELTKHTREVGCRILKLSYISESIIAGTNFEDKLSKFSTLVEQHVYKV